MKPFGADLNLLRMNRRFLYTEESCVIIPELSGSHVVRLPSKSLEPDADLLLV